MRFRKPASKAEHAASFPSPLFQVESTSSKEEKEKDKKEEEIEKEEKEEEEEKEESLEQLQVALLDKVSSGLKKLPHSVEIALPNVLVDLLNAEKSGNVDHNSLHIAFGLNVKNEVGARKRVNRRLSSTALIRNRLE